MLRRAFDGARAGHRRGEHPGAHPRQPRDGAVEQVRLARAHHRQQVGDVGGLRDALRRHGGRLRRAEGRLQGLGLPARALAQRAGGARAGAELGARRGRRRPSCATSSATRTRCRPTTCSTRSWTATSRRTSTRTSWCAAACPREDVERVIRMVDRAEYKRRQAPPGIKISTKAFGRDRRLPITNRFRRSLGAGCDGGGRTAIVTRDSAHRRPSSSVNFDVPDPGGPAAVERAALACTVPSVIGRRKLVLFDWPIARLPSRTAMKVPSEHQRLRHRRVDAPVHQAERLPDLSVTRHATLHHAVPVPRAARSRARRRAFPVPKVRRQHTRAAGYRSASHGHL